MIEFLATAKLIENIASSKANRVLYAKIASKQFDNKWPIPVPDKILSKDNLKASDLDAKQRLLQLQDEFRDKLPKKVLQRSNYLLSAENISLPWTWAALAPTLIGIAYLNDDLTYLQKTAMAVTYVAAEVVTLAAAMTFPIKGLLNRIVQKELIFNFNRDMADFKTSEGIK
jgi:hypothetical protein